MRGRDRIGADCIIRESNWPSSMFGDVGRDGDGMSRVFTFTRYPNRCFGAIIVGARPEIEER